MILSLGGGACIALAPLLIALLRGTASREPKPFWARRESTESTVAIGIVAILAIGISMMVTAAGSGLVSVLLGLAVAVGGSILAVVIGGRRNTRTSARAAAKAA